MPISACLCSMRREKQTESMYFGVKTNVSLTARRAELDMSISLSVIGKAVGLLCNTYITNHILFVFIHLIFT